jgi:HEAT repeat protein
MTPVMGNLDPAIEAERTIAELRERNRSFRSPLEALDARVLVDRLGEIGAHDALREITTAPEMNPHLREHAAWLLGEARRPEDLPLLIAMMRDDYIQDLAQLVVEQSWGVEAVPAMLGRLPHRDHDALCLIEALGNVGDERALEPLRQILESSLDESEQLSAASAIITIAERGHAGASEAARAVHQAALEWRHPGG